MFLFVGVTVLTLSLWVTDPQYTDTTPVSDLSFFALGAIIGLGFISQLRTPEHTIAGVQQAIIGILSLGMSGLLISDRIESLVGSLLFLLAAAILLALHPARRDFFKLISGRVSATLGMLVALAAIPSFWYAAEMLARRPMPVRPASWGNVPMVIVLQRWLQRQSPLWWLACLPPWEPKGRGLQSGVPE